MQVCVDSAFHLACTCRYGFVTFASEEEARLIQSKVSLGVHCIGGHYDEDMKPSGFMQLVLNIPKEL